MAVKAYGLVETVGPDYVKLKWKPLKKIDHVTGYTIYYRYEISNFLFIIYYYGHSVPVEVMSVESFLFN